MGWPWDNIGAALTNVWQGITNPGDAINSAEIRAQAAARGLTVDQYMPLLRAYQETPHKLGNSFDDFLANNPVGKAIAPVLANGVSVGSLGQSNSPTPLNTDAVADNAAGQFQAMQHSAMPLAPPSSSNVGNNSFNPLTTSTNQVGETKVQVSLPTDLPAGPATNNVGMNPVNLGNVNSATTPESLAAFQAAKSEANGSTLNPVTENGFNQTGGGPTQSVDAASGSPAPKTPTDSDTSGIPSWLLPYLPLLGAAGQGLLTGDAAKNAANAAIGAGDVSAAGYNQAQAVGQQQFEQQQRYLNPYLDAGTKALGDLQNFDQNHQFNFDQNDPAYQWRFSEGLKSLKNSMGGDLYGGNTLKALNDYGQGAASQERQQQFNNWNTTNNNQRAGLQTLAGYGQNATNQAVNASQNYAQNSGNDFIGAANAKANAQIGAANVNSSAYTNLGNVLSGAVTSTINNQQSQNLINVLKQNKGV